mgnify:CR=1 FL=1|jgi:hypothetical protein
MAKKRVYLSIIIFLTSSSLSPSKIIKKMRPAPQGHAHRISIKRRNNFIVFTIKLLPLQKLIVKNYTFISTSTPLGSSNFIRASTV